MDRLRQRIELHELVVPAHAASIGAARGFVRTVLDGRAAERLDDVLLAVSELVTNAVEHGLGGNLSTRLRIRGAAELIEIAVASESVLRPRRRGPVSVDALTGRGLPIVHALADDVVVTGSGREVIVTCRFGQGDPDDVRDRR